MATTIVSDLLKELAAGWETSREKVSFTDKIAAETQVSKNTAYQYITGRRQVPLGRLQLLVNAFGWDLAWFVDESRIYQCRNVTAAARAVSQAVIRFKKEYFNNPCCTQRNWDTLGFKILNLLTVCGWLVDMHRSAHNRYVFLIERATVVRLDIFNKGRVVEAVLWSVDGEKIHTRSSDLDKSVVRKIIIKTDNII